MKKMIFSAALVVAAMCFTTSVNAQDVKVKGKVATEKKECCKAKELPQQVDATTAATGQAAADKKDCCKKAEGGMQQHCDKKKDACKKADGKCDKAAADKKDCCKKKAAAKK